MADSWTVPVRGQMTTIERIPDSECEICAKCRQQLGAAQYRGRRQVREKMDGVNHRGEAEMASLRIGRNFYYCSPGCLEAHGAVADEDFSFGP